MSVQKYLSTRRLDITRYSPRANVGAGHVAFSGVPRKHPYDRDKLLLLADPFSTHAVFYEFNLVDIAMMEELPNLVSERGESALMARVWVKKGSFGLRYEPFRVEDTVSLAGKKRARAARKRRS